MPKKLTQEEFIRRARLVHGDKFDYSKVEYVNNDIKVCITCLIHGEFWQRPSDHLRGCGCKKCGKIKAGESTRGIKRKNRVRNGVYGVGTSDEIFYEEKLVKVWRGMIQRGYDKKLKDRYPSYKDCLVCDEWHSLSNFMRWATNPTNGYHEGYVLDKDILIKNNKVYSPQTCCFVPVEINLLLIKRGADRGKYPLGVTTNKVGKYVAMLSKHGVSVYVGCFYTPEEAFQAYKTAKESYIKEVATAYYNRGEITQKVYDALMEYEVEITD